MSTAARVLSIDALAELRDALHRFAEKAGRAVEGAQNEVRRSLDALEQRQQFWQQEIRRREEEVTRAKSELARRRWAGGGTSDQELALARAHRGLHEAEDKLQTARRWLRQLPQDVGDFESRAGALVNFLDHEMKRAVVLLQSKIDALEAYTRLVAAEGGTPP